MQLSESGKNLKKAHRRVKPNLMAAGIPEAKVDGLLADVGILTDTAIEVNAAKLRAVELSEAYRGFVNVYSQQPPAWWANMAMLGETGGREHKILDTAAKALRKEWKRTNAKAKPDATESNPA